jgi:hypothetical protein
MKHVLDLKTVTGPRYNQQFEDPTILTIGDNSEDKSQVWQFQTQVPDLTILVAGSKTDSS